MPDIDLNDPLVRQMADRNHVPIEDWTLGGDVRVLCETCPCCAGENKGDWFDLCDTCAAAAIANQTHDCDRSNAEEDSDA